MMAVRNLCANRVTFHDEVPQRPRVIERMAAPSHVEAATFEKCRANLLKWKTSRTADDIRAGPPYSPSEGPVSVVGTAGPRSLSSLEVARRLVVHSHREGLAATGPAGRRIDADGAGRADPCGTLCGVGQRCSRRGAQEYQSM
jgi:hypothetical protein